MFEATDPVVFSWYIKHDGPAVNPFVDHSQIVELECLRAGSLGTASLWGRVVTFGDRCRTQRAFVVRRDVWR